MGLNWLDSIRTLCFVGSSTFLRVLSNPVFTSLLVPVGIKLVSRDGELNILGQGALEKRGQVAGAQQGMWEGTQESPSRKPPVGCFFQGHRTKPKGGINMEPCVCVKQKGMGLKPPPISAVPSASATAMGPAAPENSEGNIRETEAAPWAQLVPLEEHVSVTKRCAAAEAISGDPEGKGQARPGNIIQVYIHIYIYIYYTYS